MGLLAQGLEELLARHRLKGSLKAAWSAELDNDMAEAVAAWWTKVASLAAALGEDLQRTADGRDQWKDLTRIRGHLAAECAHVPARGALDLDDVEVAAWQQWLREAPSWTLEATMAVSTSLQALARRAQRSAASLALKGFHAWVVQAATSGAS